MVFLGCWIRHSDSASGVTMYSLLQPWQLLFAILAGWFHRGQQEIIEFQNSEIISLMQSQGKKRIRADR
jgi:hypothetical protein